MLVNIARALKYLELYGQRQSQLFTVLEKYHQVPDGLEDLKSQFSFLKETTSRNVENLQQAITVHQTYTTNLCGHVNVILSRLIKVENDIQKLTKKITTEQDIVQIDAPDFDPDMDGPNPQRAHNNTAVVSVQELFTSPEPESIDTTNTQEEATDSVQFNTGHSNLEGSHRSGSFPQQISNQSSDNSFTKQQQISPVHNNILDEILPLEEDWENHQFTAADTYIINRHNTHSESERIQKEYTEQLLDLTDNQYYSEEYPSTRLQYSIPGPDYYGPLLRRSNTQPHNPAGYYPPHQIQQTLSIRLFGEKVQSAESRKVQKRWQNYKPHTTTQSSRLLSPPPDPTDIEH